MRKRRCETSGKEGGKEEMRGGERSDGGYVMGDTFQFYDSGERGVGERAMEK